MITMMDSWKNIHEEEPVHSIQPSKDHSSRVLVCYHEEKTSRKTNTEGLQAKLNYA